MKDEIHASLLILTDRLTGNRNPPFGVLVNRLSVKNTCLNLVICSRNEVRDTYM